MVFDHCKEKKSSWSGEWTNCIKIKWQYVTSVLNMYAYSFSIEVDQIIDQCRIYFLFNHLIYTTYIHYMYFMLSLEYLQYENYYTGALLCNAFFPYQSSGIYCKRLWGSEKGMEQRVNVNNQDLTGKSLIAYLIKWQPEWKET